MQVTVALFGPYAELLPPGSERGRATLDVAEGTTVGQLLDRLGVPDQGRHFVTVDGRRVEPTGALSSDAEVRVIVPLGGG
jgi:molybdopterin synthase sulfur carrier subunit